MPRITDGNPFDLAPGDYMLTAQRVLWLRTPNGALGRITAPPWTSIEEHEDGTITVDPSIEIHGGGDVPYWHGHLVRGVFTG